jgi:dynein heavy chain
MLTGKDKMTDYSRMQQMLKDFTPYSSLWLTTRNWFKLHQSWLNDPWEDLDAVNLENVVDNSNKTVSGVLRYFKDRELPKVLKIAEIMKGNIDEFKPYVPLAVALRKEGMYERHWDQISGKVGFDIRPVEGFTLTSVIDKGLLNNLEICEEVGEKAAKEYNIECSLTKMQGDWKGVDFLLPKFKTTTTNYISGFEDAIAMLDEHIVTTQAMQFSPFKKPFEEEIEDWNRKLMLVSDTLEEWIKCQGQWMYLQPIFDSPDIVKQLPQESKRFKSVDSTWRHIMN